MTDNVQKPDAPQKNWQEMLQDVINLRTEEAETRRARGKIAEALVNRLHDVFNSEAANRLLPAVTKAARKKKLATMQEGAKLCNEVMDNILNNTLDAEGLSLVAAHARDITPVNDMMMGMLQPVAYAAYRAMHNSLPAWEATDEAYREKMRALELSVFERYLEQRPETVQLLDQMTATCGISVAAGSPEDVALKSVATDVKTILRTHFMQAVEVVPMHSKAAPKNSYRLISGENGALHKAVKAHLKA